MRGRIRRYRLSDPGLLSPTVLEVPAGATPLQVGEEDGDLCVWMLVDPSVAPATRRLMQAVATDWDFDLPGASYVGSTRIGQWAWHVFDLGEAR